MRAVIAAASGSLFRAAAVGARFGRGHVPKSTRRRVDDGRPGTMPVMERRRRTVLALLVTAATIALPFPTVDRTAASEPVERPSLVATRRRWGLHDRRRDRRPLQHRTRRHLRRRPADLVGQPGHRRRLDRDDPQHLGRADRPGRAEHDRGEARRHAPQEGDRGWRSGRGDGQGPDHQRAAGPQPGSQREHVGPGPLSRDAALEPRGLELAVHSGQRHRRPLSLAAVGQPPDPLRATEPRRSIRHAIEPVGDGPDRDRRAASSWPRAARVRRSARTGCARRSWQRTCATSRSPPPATT